MKTPSREAYHAWQPPPDFHEAIWRQTGIRGPEVEIGETGKTRRGPVAPNMQVARSGIKRRAASVSWPVVPTLSQDAVRTNRPRFATIVRETFISDLG